MYVMNKDLRNYKFLTGGGGGPRNWWILKEKVAPTRLMMESRVQRTYIAR